MAMRRRIKVAANLTAAKRKPKTETVELSNKNDNAQESSISCPIPQVEATIKNTEKSDDTTPNVELPTDKDVAAFKFPPKVDFNRSNSYASSHSTQGMDETQSTEIDGGVHVMQMDLQQASTALPMSPTKVQRQRIKATPVFGQRRNSFVGSLPTQTPANEDINDQITPFPKRERHYSGSQSHTLPLNNAPVRPMPYGSGRIRTESSCSVFSDSHFSTTSKSRKAEEHGSQRQTMRRDFEARFSNGVPDKSALKMSDLIYYNPISNPMEQKPKISEIKAEKTEPEFLESEKSDTDNSAVPVPQLKLNAHGELILDDKSLEIETTAEQEARKVLAKSSLIFLDENTGMNGFYKRHKRTRDWPPDETIRFYRCLQTIGTDFSLMCQLFPKRTRRDIKLKFKKEERCNGALINKALLHPNMFNIDELKDQFEIEDREREEEEKEKANRKKEYKKVQIKASKAARALKNADDVYNLCEGSTETEANKNTSQPRTKRVKKLMKTESQSLDNEMNCKKSLKRPRPMKTKENVTTYISEAIDPNISIVKSEQIVNPKIEPSHESSTTKMMAYLSEIPVEKLEKESQHSIEVRAFDYESDDSNFEAPGEVFFDEDEDSRVFVNMDSGNVTLIRDENLTQNDLVVQPVMSIKNDGIYTEQYAGAQNSILYIDAEHSLNSTYDNVMQVESNEQDNVSKDDVTLKNISKKDKNIAEKIQSSKTAADMDDDEVAIAKILEDIANGSLQVVSSFDPSSSSPDEPVTEIYMLDRTTGELCDEPIDVPPEIVKGILSILS